MFPRDFTSSRPCATRFAAMVAAVCVAAPLSAAAVELGPPAIFLRFADSGGRLMRCSPSAYGVYLLHYIFIIWLQYAVYDYSLPADVKFAIVFAGTLAMSWALTAMLRKIPVVARMI